MSRIGKSPVAIPQGVTVDIKDNIITVKGKLGELSQEFSSEMTVKVEDGNILLERPSDSKDHTAKHGLYRALINKLDKEGVEYLITDKIDPLLEGLGFKKLDKSNQDICLELKDQDDSDLDSLFWVAIKGYFD